MDKTLKRILSLIPKKEDGTFVHGAKKDFAESIGYSDGQIVSMWENGTSYSYRKKLHEISAVYGVSIEWLKGETDKKIPSPMDGDGLSPAKQKLLAAVDELSDEQCEKLFGIIEEVKKLF